MIKGFNNWVYPDAKDLALEYKIEYIGHYADSSGTFETEREFIEAVNESETVNVNGETDYMIGYRSRCDSYECLLDLIRTYRSYPEFRNERTLKAIYNGFETNSKMKMPIILKYADGRMRILSGNTRADVAMQLLGYYKAILVDLAKYVYEVNV